MFKKLCKYNHKPTVNPNDPLFLGVVTKDASGKQKFTPVWSSQTFDSLRKKLEKCQHIDTSACKNITNAYWDILTAEAAKAINETGRLDLIAS